VRPNPPLAEITAFGVIASGEFGNGRPRCSSVSGREDRVSQFTRDGAAEYYERLGNDIGIVFYVDSRCDGGRKLCGISVDCGK
jgi:hypothetical protein